MGIDGQSLGGVPLSVLDLAPIVEGATARDALLNSVDLCRHVEELGYHRHWVAEHHNSVGVASSATAVLMAHLAAATSTIRIGSGGVMLPNHSPLVIAEQFGTLEAMHPGRIDLGIGRAPGTDRVTAHALRRNLEQTGDDLPELLGELFGFFGGTFPEGHPYRTITVVPGLGNMPAIWLLGSSGYSAQLAGMLGLPFSFAHHFSAENTLPALDLYRKSFQPSGVLAEPYAMVAVMVICAESDEEAERIASPWALHYVRRFHGERGRLQSNEDALSYPYSDREREAIEVRSAAQAIGGPDRVKRRLESLVAETGANELMIATSTFEAKDRLRSYELVAAMAENSD